MRVIFSLSIHYTFCFSIAAVSKWAYNCFASCCQTNASLLSNILVDNVQTGTWVRDSEDPPWLWQRSCTRRPAAVIWAMTSNIFLQWEVLRRHANQLSLLRPRGCCWASWPSWTWSARRGGLGFQINYILKSETLSSVSFQNSVTIELHNFFGPSASQLRCTVTLQVVLAA